MLYVNIERPKVTSPTKRMAETGLTVPDLLLRDQDTNLGIMISSPSIIIVHTEIINKAKKSKRRKKNRDRDQRRERKRDKKRERKENERK